MPTLLFNSSNFLNMSGLATADNGLTANPATNVQLGGALVKNTVVSVPGAFQLQFGNLVITNGAVKVTSTPVNPTDVARLQDIVPIVASYKNALNTVGTNTLYSYVTTVSGLFRLSYAIVCDSVAGGNGDLFYSYTDESGVNHSIDIGTFAAIGATNLANVCIYAQAATAITLDLAIAGSINFHVASILEFLK